MLLLTSESYADSLNLVTLIIGLLLVGLVVDLGGGPHGDRIGFRVCTI